MSFDAIIGGIIAVIVAGMPAMIALLKIKDLHLAVNSRMDKFIEATRESSKAREDASLVASEDRMAGVVHSRDLLIVQNTQLIDHIAELAKRIDSLPCSALAHRDSGEKPPCTV